MFLTFFRFHCIVDSVDDNGGQEIYSEPYFFRITRSKDDVVSSDIVENYYLLNNALAHT